MLKNIEDAKKLFRKQKVSFTKQRATILNILREHSTEHLTAEQVYDIVKQRDPKIGLATVYRTLSLLESMGLIRQSHLPGSSMKYETVSEDDGHEHHHLLCETCGEIQDIEDDLLEDLERLLKKKAGFSVTNHRVVFFGQCVDCNKPS